MQILNLLQKCELEASENCLYKPFKKPITVINKKYFGSYFSNYFLSVDFDILLKIYVS